MRISDWSSDVCSSDLPPGDRDQPFPGGTMPCLAKKHPQCYRPDSPIVGVPAVERPVNLPVNPPDLERLAIFRRGLHWLPEIGRASCRERVCQYVEISVVAVSLKKKKIEIHNII